MSTIEELSRQLIEAGATGDNDRLKEITEQLIEATKPPSFSEIWNYEQRTPEPAKDGFSKYWNFEHK